MIQKSSEGSAASTSLPQKPTWEAAASRRREELNTAVNKVLSSISLPSIPSPTELPNGTPFIHSILTSDEIEITEAPTASDLLFKLSSGNYTSTEVTQAFLKRAALAHKLTNCLTDILPDTAIQRAKELDEYYQKHGKTVGPLHGLPISLKDQFRVQGTETSLGYVDWLGKSETEESESWVVKRLREMGAIVYAKTNVPTSLMVSTPSLPSSLEGTLLTHYIE